MGWQLAEQASQIGTAYHSTFKCLVSPYTNHANKDKKEIYGSGQVRG